jgi:hypothetical protein
MLHVCRDLAHEVRFARAPRVGPVDQANRLDLRSRGCREKETRQERCCRRRESSDNVMHGPEACTALFEEGSEIGGSCLRQMSFPFGRLAPPTSG